LEYKGFISDSGNKSPILFERCGRSFEAQDSCGYLPLVEKRGSARLTIYTISLTGFHSERCDFLLEMKPLFAVIIGTQERRWSNLKIDICEVAAT
jgi:hypothetical protein